MTAITKFAGTSPQGTRVSVAGLEELATILTTADWAPSTFKRDYRNIANFEAMHFLALDIDDGMTLDKAKVEFKDFACLIGTSRNHQKVKYPGQPSEQPARDRFRVVFALDRAITSDTEYKEAFAGLQYMVAAVDPATKNADRFFFACATLEHCNPNGRVLAAGDLLEAAVIARIARPRPAFASQATTLQPGRKGPLASSTKDFLLFGKPPGEWNPALYKAARDLHQQGYALDEAVPLLEKPAKVPGNAGYLDEKDMQTIRSAFSKDPSYPARAPQVLPPPPAEPGVDRSKSFRFHTLCDELRAGPGKFSMDERSGEVFLDGQLLLVEPHVLRAREALSRRGLKMRKEEVLDAHVLVAHENRFNPVTDYLSGLVWDGTSRWCAAPSELLGVEAKSLFSTYLTKWAISAVARAFAPGCKVDTVLILQGAQAAGKSTFFRILGGSWFTDSNINMEDKDGYMVISRNWIIEWPELDSVIRTRNQSTVKAFISKGDDQYRRPYAKDVSVSLRSSVFVGTTNDSEFLGDETGSRRFWIVAGVQKVDNAKTSSWRDQLWAEAVHHYRVGEQWHLTPEEEAIREESNSVHRYTDPWLAAIDGYLAKQPATITIADVLSQCLGLENREQSHQNTSRVAKCLRELGWESKKTNKARFWVRGAGHA